MDKVAIVVDSSVCLPKYTQESHGIFVVPHILITNEKEYRDGVDITAQQFYTSLEQTGVISTTSGPSPESFIEAFHLASQSANRILCLTLSANFSPMTYNSAMIAAKVVNEENADTWVTVIDSNAAAGAEGFIALEASRAALDGQSLEEILSLVNSMIPRVKLVAFLDTLYYLRKGGRVPMFKAWAGTLLGFKPITELSQGTAKLISKPRSRIKAKDQLFTLLNQRVGHNPVHVNVMHANSQTEAEDMLDRIQDTLNCLEIFISEFTPVMGAHTGPGVLGLAFYSDIPNN